MKTLSKFFIALAFVGLSAGASAQTSGSCGANLTWQLTGAGNNLTLTISGTGAMANYYSGIGAPWISQQLNIKSLVIEEGVTTIGNYAFWNLLYLTEITIGNYVTTIGNSAFEGCRSLTAITIPNSVITIGDYAFQFCVGLTEITIPNYVITIGGGAFKSCQGLTGITIGNSVTTIGNSAFEGCSGLLTAITIPNSVTTIGDYAFSSCYYITSITSSAINPPALGTNAFYNVSNSIPVYVPCDSINAYRNAWNYFTNIQGIMNCDNDTNCNTYITIYDTICSNALPYLLNGFYASTAGLHQRVIANSVNCDSVISLNLFVINCDNDTSCNTYITIDDTICSNALPYLLNGFYVSTTGLYQRVVADSVSCDSVIYLNLFVINCDNDTNCNTYTTIYDTICENYLPYTHFGFYINTSGNHTLTLQNMNGCDSVVTLELMVIPTSETTIYDTICGNGYEYYFNGSLVITSGTYTAVLPNSYGCDSIITLHLFVEENCIDWTFENDTLTISGIGAMPDYDITNPQHISNKNLRSSSEIAETSAPWNIHSEEILHIVIGEGITKVGAYAFYNCVNALSAELASTVGEIGEYAFAQCGVLEEIIIHNENGIDVDETAFENVNTSQIKLVVPEGSEDNYNNDDIWGEFIIGEESNIDEILANSISIFPNPAKELLTINNGQLTINNLEICDISGKTLISLQPLNYLNPTINVANLSSGIYLLKIHTDKGIKTERFVKK